MSPGCRQDVVGTQCRQGYCYRKLGICKRGAMPWSPFFKTRTRRPAAGVVLLIVIIIVVGLLSGEFIRLDALVAVLCALAP
jgi:hypothetical protein